MCTAALIAAIAMATLMLQEAPALPHTRPTNPWFGGKRYVWRKPLNEGTYDALAKVLPAPQREFTTRGRSGDVVPIDCLAGPDRPRLTYVLTRADTVPLRTYARAEFIEFLDLYYLDVSETDLRPAAQSAAVSLSLPQDWDPAGGFGQALLRPETLGKLSHLEIPVRRRAVRPGQIAAILRAREEIRSIQLSGEAVTDEWLSEVAWPKTMRGLRLYQSAVTNKGLRAVARDMAGLTHVALTYCDATDAESLVPMGEMPNLSELHLAGQRVTDDVLVAVAARTRVRTLVLEGRSITERGLRALEGMRSLRILVVLVATDDGVIRAARDWAARDPHRSAFLKPDEYLGGWVDGLGGQWVNQRRYDPEAFP